MTSRRSAGRAGRSSRPTCATRTTRRCTRIRSTSTATTDAPTTRTTSRSTTRAWPGFPGGAHPGLLDEGTPYDPTLGVSRKRRRSTRSVRGRRARGDGLPDEDELALHAQRLRPLGDDAPDASYGDLIYGTEEEFAGGAFPTLPQRRPALHCVARGHLQRRGMALDAGQQVPPVDVATGTRSARKAPPRRPTARPTTSRSRTGSSRCRSTARARDSWTSRIRPARRRSLTSARHRDVGDLPAQGPLLLGRPERRLRPAPDRPDGSRRASRSGRPLPASNAPGLVDADPDEEAMAALARPHGSHCSKLLPDM